MVCFEARQDRRLLLTATNIAAGTSTGDMTTTRRATPSAAAIAVGIDSRAATAAIAGWAFAHFTISACMWCGSRDSALATLALARHRWETVGVFKGSD